MEAWGLGKENGLQHGEESPPCCLLLLRDKILTLIIYDVFSSLKGQEMTTRLQQGRPYTRL